MSFRPSNTGRSRQGGPVRRRRLCSKSAEESDRTPVHGPMIAHSLMRDYEAGAAVSVVSATLKTRMATRTSLRTSRSHRIASRRVGRRRRDFRVRSIRQQPQFPRDLVGRIIQRAFWGDDFGIPPRPSSIPRRRGDTVTGTCLSPSDLVQFRLKRDTASRASLGRLGGRHTGVAGSLSRSGVTASLLGVRRSSCLHITAHGVGEHSAPSIEGRGAGGSGRRVRRPSSRARDRSRPDR